MAVGTVTISGSNIKVGAGQTASAQTISGVQGVIFDFGRLVMTLGLGGSGSFGGVVAGAASGDQIKEFDISAATTITDTISGQNHTIAVS